MDFGKRHGLHIRLRPAKGVHLVYGRRLSNIAIVASAVDGRQLFLCPHQKGAILGTTDDDYYGDLDNVTATEDDVKYLLQGMETVFPEIRRHRIIRSMAGVRPTVYEEHKYEDDLTREHLIIDHEKTEGVAGLVSMAGGKFASYRIMAEGLTDLVCRKLGREAECATFKVALPGGGSTPDPEELAGRYGVREHIVERMIYRHGSRAEDILEMIRLEPSWGSVVCRCDPVTEAEIRYSIRNEWVRRLVDLRRRVRLACGPCQGARCAVRAAEIMAEERRMSNDEMYEQAFTLLLDRWKGIRTVLSGAQFRQEEMRMWSLFGTGRLGELLKTENW
jgi:glycerol-3-phosphate dehydrogenase